MRFNYFNYKNLGMPKKYDTKNQKYHKYDTRVS